MSRTYRVEIGSLAIKSYVDLARQEHQRIQDASTWLGAEASGLCCDGG
jgi:hypothetical protein